MRYGALHADVALLPTCQPRYAPCLLGWHALMHMCHVTVLHDDHCGPQQQPCLIPTHCPPALSVNSPDES